MEDGVDISRTMQHTYDVDSVIKRSVENKVPSKWKAAHPGSEFVAGTAHHWLRREHLELLAELIHPAIGGGWIVVGDVVPDFAGYRSLQEAAALPAAFKQPLTWKLVWRALCA